MAVRNLGKTRTTHSRRPKRRTPQHRRQQRRGRTMQTAVLAAATIAHASRHSTNTPAAVASAFLRPPALSPFREGGVGAGSGCFYAISGARRCCRVPSFLECPSTMGLGVWRPPVSRGRTDRTVDVLLSSSSGQGGLFEWRWGFGPGNSNSGLDRCAQNCRDVARAFVCVCVCVLVSLCLETAPFFLSCLISARRNKS